MLNLPLRIAALFVATMVITTSAAAADWYQVEIVVFANTESNAGEAEAWPVDPGTPSAQDARSLAPPGSDGAFTVLADSQLQLGGVVAALRGSGSRRPILHTGWRQPVLERGKAEPVWIDGGARRYLADGRNVAEVAGTLLLTRSRFLHVWTDLLYAEPGAQAPTELGMLATAQATTYRMQDHRRMRSGELHYIDHPMFGLLILCTPIAAGE